MIFVDKIYLSSFLGLKTWLICIYVSTFSLISPVGVGIGIALSETMESEASAQGSLVTVLQGLATGTLLYVVFFEVIEKERIKGTNGLLQVSTNFLESSSKRGKSAFFTKGN